MSIYHKYSITNTGEFSYCYKCSKCGAMNLHSKRVRGSASYDDRGFANLEKRRQKAEDTARDFLKKRTDNYIKKINKRDFAYINLNGFCRKCKHQEIWGKTRFKFPLWWKVLHCVFIISLIPPICLVPIGWIEKLIKGTGYNKYLCFLLYGLFMTVILLVPHIVYGFKYKKLKTQISAIPESDIPHAFEGAKKDAIDAAKTFYLERKMASEEEFEELIQAVTEENQKK